MDRITSDPARALELANMIEEMVGQQNWSDDIIQNLDYYTKSGTQPATPRTSRATARIPRPETIFVPEPIRRPTPLQHGYDEVKVNDFVKQNVARRHELAIMRAAHMLELPGGTTPQVPTPAPRFVFPEWLNRAGRVAERAALPLTLLELLSYSEDTNKGEAEELANRRDPNRERKGK